MTNPIADTRALIRMGTAQRILAKQLAALALAHDTVTPEMRRIAQAIAHPQPECQQVLQAEQREVA